MMYESKLVAAIKVDNKVLREFKDTVLIPFGSEYSILIKNLNSVRALVNVYIDGINVVPNGLIIGVGQEIDLERSIVNGNLAAGNKFKFIERTSNIEQHRGVKLEDGVVRIEFEFERPHPKFNSTPAYDWRKDSNFDKGWSGAIYPQSSSALRSMVGTGSATYSAQGQTISCASGTAYNDAGITVPGSASTQKFGTAYWTYSDGEKHVMVLKLLGETPDNKPVAKPVTVKNKPKCVTCGRQNKATAKFCQECGTSLEIFA